MCGRFELKADKEYLEKIFEKRKHRLNPEYDPNIVLKQQNIAPTDKIIVIVLENDEYKLKIMKWGIRSILPQFFKKQLIFEFANSKNQIPGIYERDIFNSRIETVKKSSPWKSLIINNRCLVPMTGFYEWIKKENRKEPQRIFIEEESFFFAGGIYKPLDTKNETGASILTCEPNIFMKPIHNRMPVLLSLDSADAYLNAPKEAVFDLCEPLDNSIKMEMERVDL